MPNIKKEIELLRDRAHQIYKQTGVLSTMAVLGNEAGPHLSEQLGKLTSLLEKTVLQARELDEYCYLDARDMDAPKDYAKQWAGNGIAGSVETDQYGWLHIKLNTLLPHCKYKANPYLADTIAALLDGYRQSGGTIPFFSRALLVIDEHCNIGSRQVFDQDNKGWKVVANALKGRVVKDDDQFSLSVAMLSTWDDVPSCHIYALDPDDAGTFFDLRAGGCGSYFAR